MEPFLRGSTSVKMLQLMILFHLEIISILIYTTLIFCIGKLLHILSLIISLFIYLGENNCILTSHFYSVLNFAFQIILFS